MMCSAALLLLPKKCGLSKRSASLVRVELEGESCAVVLFAEEPPLLVKFSPS